MSERLPNESPEPRPRRAPGPAPSALCVSMFGENPQNRLNQNRGPRWYVALVFRYIPGTRLELVFRVSEGGF
jgi:hypothetical protein